ncbi:MAG TPA: hypothetical protein VFH06_04820 [Candidatus Saccharimonadales bacterium]|nr:hypothetical protein [Candidatus Saccharimonadales bacterium]
MTKPRFEDFAYTTPYDEDAIAKAAIETRERAYVSTGAGDTSDQKLAVYLTVPEGVNRKATPIVRFPAWSDDNGRLEGGYFDALLAHATGRPVVSPNAPGVDFSEWRDEEYAQDHRITPDQIEELRSKGSFKKVGAAVARALAGASEQFGLSGDYFYHSSSQGVALAGAAVAATFDSGNPPAGIVFSEGVNFKERTMVTLGAQFALQNRYAKNYLEQNPAIIPPEALLHWASRVKEAWPANYPYITGLRRDRFLHDLGDVSGLREQGVPVLMTRGTASHLSDPIAYNLVRNYLQAKGVVVFDKQYKDHDHPYTMTVQSVVDAVKEIA